MAYWRLHYHLVWSTYQREPMIDREGERVIFGVFFQKAKALNLIIHAVGNTSDHVHVVVSIPPKIAVSDCVRHLKGASAHAINQMTSEQHIFKWQEGFGAISIGKRSLSTVMDYVYRQK